MTRSTTRPAFSYNSPYNASNNTPTASNTPLLTEQKLLDAFVQFMEARHQIKLDFEQQKFLNCMVTVSPPPQSYSYTIGNKVLEGIAEFCRLVAKKYEDLIIGYQPLASTSPPIKALMKTTLLGFVKAHINHLLSFYHFTHDYNGR